MYLSFSVGFKQLKTYCAVLLKYTTAVGCASRDFSLYVGNKRWQMRQNFIGRVETAYAILSLIIQYAYLHFFMQLSVVNFVFLCAVQTNVHIFHLYRSYYVL